MCSGRVKTNLLDKTVEYPTFKASFKFDKKLNFLFFLKESVLLYEYISTGIYSNFENFQPVIREITLNIDINHMYDIYMNHIFDI
jgi:hypothetical protein